MLASLIYLALRRVFELALFGLPITEFKALERYRLQVSGQRLPVLFTLIATRPRLTTPADTRAAGSAARSNARTASTSGNSR